MAAAKPFPRDPCASLRALAGSSVQLQPADGAFAGAPGDDRTGPPRAAILARLVSADADAVLLTHPTPRADALPLHAGQLVLVRLYTGSEILQFRSTVLSAPSARAQHTRLAPPASISYLTARRANRIPIQLAATSVGRDGTEKPVMLLDFSSAGCHATSTSPLGLRGAPLRLQFMVPAGPVQQTHAVVNGRIRWMNERAAGGGWHFAHGIELDSGWAQRQLLEQLVTCFRLSTACGRPLADDAQAVDTGMAPAPDADDAASHDELPCPAAPALPDVHRAR